MKVLGNNFHYFTIICLRVSERKNSALGSVQYHTGVAFDCEETLQWSLPGGYMCSKLIIFMDVDSLSRFHFM